MSYVIFLCPLLACIMCLYIFAIIIEFYKGRETERQQLLFILCLMRLENLKYFDINSLNSIRRGTFPLNKPMDTMSFSPFPFYYVEAVNSIFIFLLCVTLSNP